MKTDMQLGEIANQMLIFLNRNKCTALEVYAILGMMRHSIDKKVDQVMISQTLQKSKQEIVDKAGG